MESGVNISARLQARLDLLMRARVWAIGAAVFWGSLAFLDILVRVPQWLVSFWPVAYVTAAAFLPLATVFTLVLLFLVCREAGGLGYAVSHLLLAILLIPVAFIGVALLPLAVQADIEKGTAAWRRAGSPPPQRDGTA